VYFDTVGWVMGGRPAPAIPRYSFLEITPTLHIIGIVILQCSAVTLVMCVLWKNNQHAELWRYGVGAAPTAPVETFKAHSRCISWVFASSVFYKFTVMNENFEMTQQGHWRSSRMVRVGSVCYFSSIICSSHFRVLFLIWYNSCSIFDSRWPWSVLQFNNDSYKVTVYDTHNASYWTSYETVDWCLVTHDVHCCAVLTILPPWQSCHTCLCGTFVIFMPIVA